MNNDDNKINITEEEPTINIVNEENPVTEVPTTINITPVSDPPTTPNVPGTNSPIIPNNVVSEVNKEEKEKVIINTTASTNNTVPVDSNNNTIVKESTSGTVTNNIPKADVNTEEPAEKETLKDKLKRVLLVVFLIFAGVFVFFLPNISEYLNGMRGASSSGEAAVENGFLKCTRTYENDSSSTEYEYLLNFKNKSLTDGTYTTTYENEDEKKVNENNEKCKKVEELSEKTEGIDVSCSISSNISTTTQNNIYRNIKTGNLTAFTEAGGIYPEYKYGDDIYGIEAKLVKAGFDCDISADSN